MAEIFLLVHLMAWVCVAAVSFFLMQIPHIWSNIDGVYLRFDWMFKSAWFTCSRPRKHSVIRNITGVNTFDDAFHFFGNLPRIHMMFIIWGFYGWLYGVGMFFVWAILWELTRVLFTVKDEK